MDRQQIFNILEEVFKLELGMDDIKLTDTTTADDIEEWDSLSHIQLVSAIEDALSISFSSREIMKWKNVGEMVDSIINKK